MTPDEFSSSTIEWITACSAILEHLIIKLGLLAAAGFALYLAIKSKHQEVEAQIALKNQELQDKIDAMMERQDRHSARLTQVALAVPATDAVQQVEVVNTETDPIPTVETEP